MTTLYPLQFTPVIRDYLWGGRRLSQTLGKPLGDRQRAAESWEIVDHGADQSLVAHGSLTGQTLAALLEQYGDELLGRSAAAASGGFPLLLKYLDCHQDLSVQVHPSDAYAQTMDPPDLGKTEAWYIVDAQPGSVLYAGLLPGVDRDALAAAVADGRTDQVLHTLHPQPGDCVFIPAGTVHALGAGLLVAEIQQASDTTFRLFDWNRRDAEGRSRPLHIDQALQVTDYERGPISQQTPGDSEHRWQKLVRCDKFLLDRCQGRGEFPVAETGGFSILTVPHGSAVLHWQSGTLALPTGGSVLIPAAIGAYTVELGQAHSTVLRMGLP